MRYQAHGYQARAEEFIIEHPYCAMFLDMGLGKTVTTLTALRRLKEDYLEADRILVIAPKSVAENTWTTECGKWDHLRHLKVAVVMGTAAQREKALERDADIWVINRENLVWLVDRYRKGKGRWPFDCVVIDESSSFKTPSSKRFRAMRAVRPLTRRVILLTGTPSPNGMMDLWPQMWLVDMGESLGRTLTEYRSRYFRPGRRNGNVIYEWILTDGARERIADRISGKTLSMSAAEYLELPDRIETDRILAMEDKALAAYRKFEEEQLMELDGADIEAVTAAALTNKLLQFSGGAVYDTEGEWHETSRAKIEALRDIMEEADGPVLVYYQYRHELERLQAAFRDEAPVAFRGEPDMLKAWNEGRIRMLLCQPASVQYGLNMQQGGRIIVWYSPTWNLEQYQQANARLHRQGQTRPVLIYRLLCEGTMDDRVIRALCDKDHDQSSLLREVRRLRDEYRSR